MAYQNSFNNFLSSLPSFVQIGEIVWEEFEKVGFFNIMRCSEKKKRLPEMGVASTTRFSTIHWMHGYKVFECATKCMGVISQNALSLITVPPSGGNSGVDYKICRQVWVIFQVWWVLGYFQAVKNTIISSEEKKINRNKESFEIQ